MVVLRLAWRSETTLSPVCSRVCRYRWPPAQGDLSPGVSHGKGLVALTALMFPLFLVHVMFTCL